MTTAAAGAGLPLEVLQEARAGALGIDDARIRAAACHACDLWARATQTVFGEGPVPARLMLVGEQPGDLEDRRGHPFVGPAGRILDEAFERAGIDRSRTFVTNVVKHFRWRAASGTKRRLHERPDRTQVAACRPLASPLADVVLLTIHPSAVLRAGGERRRHVMDAFVADLKTAHDLVEGGG